MVLARHFRIWSRNWGNLAVRMRRFDRNSRSLLSTLAGFLANRKNCLRAAAGDNGVRNVNNRLAKEGQASLIHHSFLDIQFQSQSTASTRSGSIPRSFSIKNHANSPWNALDLHKILGLCCIQLKLQFSRKPTFRR
jgi:hypothetical protein